MPVELAKDYKAQILKGDLVFLHENNIEELSPLVAKELLEQKKIELEMRRVEELAGPLIMIPDAWYCIPCTCINADILAKCSECGEAKPEGADLKSARESATYWARSRHEQKLQKMRDELRKKDAASNNEPPAA